MTVIGSCYSAMAIVGTPGFVLLGALDVSLLAIAVAVRC